MNNFVSFIVGCLIGIGIDALVWLAAYDISGFTR